MARRPKDTGCRPARQDNHHALVEVAAQLLKLKAETQDKTIALVLQRLGTLLGVDRGYVFQFSEDLSRMSNTHEWCAKGIKPQIERIQEVPTGTMPWWKEQITQLKPVLVPTVDDLPPEAQAERDEFRSQEIQSLICLPLMDERDHLTGVMGFDAVRAPRSWSEQETDMLVLTAHLLATALGRIRAQRELEESEALLDATGSIARVGGWQLDVETLTVTWTRETYRIHEVSPHEQPPLEKAIEFFHPDDRPTLSRAIRRAIDLGEPYDMEVRLLTAKGTELWARTICHPEVEDGKTIRLRGVLQDITERKQAEQAIRDEAELLARTEQIARIGSWKLDLATNHLHWSDEVYRIFGCDPQAFEATYEAFLSFIHPDDRAAVDEAYTRSVREGHGGYQIEHRILRKGTGEERIIREECAHDFNASGAVIRSSGMVQDITERKRVENYQALTAEILEQINRPAVLEDVLHKVLAAIRARTGCAAVGIRLSSGEDFPYFVQHGFSSDFLLTENSLIARDPQGGICRNPDGSVSLECTCGLVLSGRTDPSNPLFSPGGSAWTNDSLPILKVPPEADPRLHPRNQCIHAGYASIALIPIRMRQKIVGLLHINHRKKNQFSAEVIQLLEGVAAHIGDALIRVQMEEEKDKLQAHLMQAQKMEVVGRLAGGVAHDFNNMLTVILGEAELAMGAAGDQAPLRAGLEEIRKAARRSADLTQQLLAFARKQTVAPKVLDLNRTIAGMLDMLQRLIGEEIDLVWYPGSEIYPVFVDPVQVDQLLVNLCINARDAIAGSGKITVETDNVALDKEYCAKHAEAAPGEYVLLAVSDDGCGMDPETLSQVFEPFFTTKEVGQGTGLGLATVHGVVKQNQGFINVYSEPGHGTTFKIYLPPHTARTAPRTSRQQAAPPAAGGEVILLVEDEASILKTTTRLLEGLGYTVIASASPGEAIRLAREYKGQIDLLLTDVVMPEMNGRDLARNLISIYPDIKRLFMSGYTANVIAHHGVLDTGVHFIQKPFSKTALAARIREALGQE